MKKQLIIYDLDGTLVDTAKDIAQAANHMLRELNAKAVSRREISRYVGKGLHHLIKNCLKTEDQKQIEKGAKIYRQFYAEHLMDHSKLYPGALQFLDYFKSRKQAVMTNKPNPFSEDILKALGVSDYFTAIVAGDSQHPKKPDASALFWLMDQQKIEPAAALLVGDSPIDIETARNAGIEAAVLSHGFADEDEIKSARPDYRAADFEGLLRLAKEKGW